MRPLRRDMQIVFQDPFGSLSPRLSVAEIVEEGLIAQKSPLNAAQRREAVARALADTGLDPATMDRYPHEFSGGQRQRIAIARALLKDAPVLALDEATSQLDYETEGIVQRSIHNSARGRTLLVVAHRLSTIRHADEIIVLESGQICERGTHDDLIRAGGLYASLWRLQNGTSYDIFDGSA
jgi:microcin C transport system ATP-binding protein